MKRADTSDRTPFVAAEWPTIESWREDDGVYVNVREAVDASGDDAASERAAETAPPD